MLFVFFKPSVFFFYYYWKMWHLEVPKIRKKIAGEKTVRDL